MSSLITVKQSVSRHKVRLVIEVWLSLSVPLLLSELLLSSVLLSDGTTGIGL